MSIQRLIAPLAMATLLAGCVVLPPSGPSMQALPGSRLSFDQFQFDDAACRQFATAQVGGRGATEAAQESAAASAVAGTLIGAATGAAFGGSSESAAVGAGFGLLTGALVGMGTSQTSYQVVQSRYDAAYYQCMYARGHRVPVFSRYSEATRALPANAPPAPPPPSSSQMAAPPAIVAVPPADAGIPPPNAPPPAAPYVPPYWPSALR
jgi:hypothetical protein